MRDRRERKERDQQAGQGFVEFALILPVLLLLMWGIIEFGRLLFIYTEVSNAAREAVRFGVVMGAADDPNYERCGSPHSMYGCEICDAGNAATVLTNLADADFTIVIDDGEDGAGPWGHKVYCEEPLYGLSEYEEVIERLVVTVKHDVRPLVLFQDAGPFQVEFTAARTLVHEGISMSGFGDVPAGNPHLLVPTGFHFDSDPAYPAGCCGYFGWNPLEGADGFALYQWLPVHNHIITTTVFEYPLSTADCMDVQHEDIYYVHGTDSSEVKDPSPPSNYAVINCLSQPENFRYEPELSCEGGAFKWTEGEYTDGYHLYTPEMITVPIGCPAGKCSYAMDLLTTGPFTLTAYNSLGDGLPSSIEVSGCTYPLDHPMLEFYKTSAAEEPCAGYFGWDGDIDDAFGYKFIRLPSDEIAGNILTGTLPTRYPLDPDTLDVADGEQYQLVPFGRGGRESGHSNVVTIVGCAGSPPSETTLYLHSEGTGWPLCLDHEGNPPLPMDGNRPSCWGEHVYNPPDANPGRKVLGSGAPPSHDGGVGETEPDRFLAWHTTDLGPAVSIDFEVRLHLWYKNTSDSLINASIYLCGYSSGDVYSACADLVNLPMTKKTYAWKAATVTWTPNLTVSDGNHLALYLTHDGGTDDVWFMYDKEYAFDPAYDSRIELTGGWHP